MKRPTIDEITRELDPRNTVDPVFYRAEQDLRKEPYHDPPQTREEFESILENFKNRCFSGGKSDAPPPFFFEMCGWSLSEKFGPRWKSITFDMARTGKNGGLPEVLKVIAYESARTGVERGISRRVDELLEPFSLEEVDQLSLDYLRKWRHIVPRHPVLISWLEGKSELSKVFFERVLKNHPYWVKGYQGAFGL